MKIKGIILMVCSFLLIAGKTNADNLQIADISMSPAQELQIAVNLQNTERSYIAFQFDMTLPEGITIAKTSTDKWSVSLNAERVGSHTLGTSDMGNNTYRILAYSLNNTSITGSEGPLVYITLKTSQTISGGNYQGKLSYQVFTGTMSIQTKFADGTPGTVDISGIKPNAYAQTAYGMSSVKQYFSSPAATIGAKSIHAPTTPPLGGGSGQKSSFPGNETSSGINTGAVGGIITSGIKFAGDTINAFSTNETGEEITARQGSSQMSIGGIGYDSQNSIDISKELESVKKQNVGNTLATVGSGAGLGAAVGSVIPGLGTAAGAVIGAGVGLVTGESTEE